MKDATNPSPLISVIIPTYNYAHFLPRAVESVLAQTYRNFEVIIIDDGSADNTSSVIKEDSYVKYFYQKNKGLSAARNAGIKKSKGDYLVFLDADDWLETDALNQNLLAIKDKPDVAFVSGNYYFFQAETNKLFHVGIHVPSNHYMRLLQSNYIGMHAAVLFQRWVFNEFGYDENLKACEDYDLYLNIARKYPVLHHEKFIATYYFHFSGLSHDHEVMMHSVKRVIQKQKPFLQSAEEETAYHEGLQQWKDYHQLLQEAM